MKTKLIVIAIVGLLVISCMGDGKRGHRSDFLPPIKIEIPAAIQSDPGLTNLVKKSEGAINEFSDNMEYLIDDLKAFQGMKEEDMGTFEKIKATKIMAEFFVNSTKGIAVLEEFNSYAEKRVAQQKPLTDEQMKAMAVIYETFEARMKQLDQKYQNVGGKKQ